uniref:Uncharacterized protein n=1 Tax=Alexandrium monilatum TaxID=311494 RepID=A0A6T0QP52_9DINO|mmetsp:Transcript_81370/g.242531  ORF Transcript_81370/g.242531 Transcript_81370/m.242531 type:complete len:128 (-) Transcript_81370:154-537(-)
MPSRNLMDPAGYIEVGKNSRMDHTHRTMVSGGTRHQRNTAAQFFVEEGHRVTVVETARNLDQYLAHTNTVIRHVDRNFEKDPIIRKIKLEEKIGQQDGFVDFGEPERSAKEQGRMAYARARNLTGKR